ncbi:MerR family transcriptional regulator [Agromyces protaetiae]|uniref:MerR family transcriptional regulator n=1 Tax=Agromyces protaetiae TaxID=2509455 RepID=A0A4P6FE43_9MICO|nr:MerR family transcriptional regulator [Agromyces protaetiae]QAY74194.1 MerR family transcriptional regulator [Agromyces protaetiae]
MARAAASRVPSGAAPLLGIGQVLARLQPEFPDLTPSKLRFLEEQGLVAPARTPAGYRKFASADVERIAFVLSMQRDHYLPLKVIRAHLASIDEGRTPALPTATAAAPAAPRRFRREDLAREAGASPTLVDEAVSAGILPPAELYGEEALDVIEAIAALRSVGIEPRHLRTVRVAAEREAALVERAIAPSRRGDPADKARTVERARELGRHLETIHATVLRQSIARLGR